MRSGPAQTIQAWAFCKSHQTARGRIPSSAMPRLADAVRRIRNDAQYNMQGLVDEQGRHILRAEVFCDVTLSCQRCLQEMTVSLAGSAVLALLLDTEAISSLPRELDPLVLGEGDELDAIEMLEDELLLALPIAPRHDADTDCARAADRSQTGTTKPFADLAQLLHERKKD